MDVLLAINQLDLRLAMDLFLREEPGLEVIGVTRDTDGLLALTRAINPGLVLVEWNLPYRPTIDILTEIKSMENPPKIITLGVSQGSAEQLVAAGTDECVMEDEPPQRLLATIRQVCEL